MYSNPGSPFVTKEDQKRNAFYIQDDLPPALHPRNRISTKKPRKIYYFDEKTQTMRVEYAICPDE